MAFGRSALFDFFCLGKKFLVFNLVSRNIKIKYRRSILGIFWTLLNPLALTLMYYFVFKLVMKVTIPHYLTFILSGVMLWSFLSTTILEGMESIVGNFGLLTKTPIPVQIFPWTGALTNLITLALSLPVIIGAAVLTDVRLGSPLILLPFYGAVLFLIGYSLSLVFAIAFVYLRDLRYLAGIIMQIWFYATPVIYDESMIPPRYRWTLVLNPVGYLFKGIHDCFSRGIWPPGSETAILCLWLVGILTLAIVLQRSCGREAVERL